MTRCKTYTDSIIVTWPKSRPLGSYLAELENARAGGLVVNYRVAHPPRPTPDRCYRVHDGHVRGYLLVLAVEHRGDGEVAHVPPPPTGLHEGCASRGGVCDCGPRPCALEFWPGGWYVVCSPVWHELKRCRHTSHESFRGWRWFLRDKVDHCERAASVGSRA